MEEIKTLFLDDNRELTSKVNGMLGGRPIGLSRKYGTAMKDYIALKVLEEAQPLIRSMLRRAKKGDTAAFVALMDRAYGKPAQAVEMTGKDGNPIVFMPLELIQKHALQIAKDVVNEEQEPIKGEVKEVKNGSIKP